LYFHDGGIGVKTTRHSDLLPWYRHAWPWGLLAGPAAAVLAGIATFALALHNNDSLVADNYYKDGLAINRVLAGATRAERYRARADIDAGGLVRLRLESDAPAPARLHLLFVHPARASEDQSIELNAAPGGEYLGRRLTPATEPYRWRVVLSHPSGAWRLSGEWSAGAPLHLGRASQ
jgi:hypothetical protein